MKICHTKTNQNITSELTRLHVYESDNSSKGNMARHEQNSSDMMTDNVSSLDDRNEHVIEISNSHVKHANPTTDNGDAAAGNKDDNYNSQDEENKEEEERQARLDKADKETCEERDRLNKEQEKNDRGKGGGKGSGKGGEERRPAYNPELDKIPVTNSRYHVITICIAPRDASQYKNDFHATPIDLKFFDPVHLNATSWPGKNFINEGLLTAIKDKCPNLSLEAQGVSLMLSTNMRKGSRPPWTYLLTILHSQKQLILPFIEWISTNNHNLTLIWSRDSIYGRPKTLNYRISTRTEPPILDEYITIEIKIPTRNVTVSTVNIEDAIRDFNRRIDKNMGWHPLIETDPDGDVEFFSENWHIERRKIGQFCPESKMFLEKESDSIYLMALKSELLNFDLKYGLPYYIFIAVAHDNTIPPTPQHRKIECTLIQSSDSKYYKKSLCRKGGRTVHDESDSTPPSIFEYVPKDVCPACNPRLDVSTNKLIFGRICPVPGCDHTYGVKKGNEEQYLADFNSHDCLRKNSSHMADYVPPTLPTVEAVVYKTGILTLKISVG